MVSLGVEKVKAVFGFAYVDGVFVRRVFEDELFEVEEGSFMGDFLADLDDCAPGVGCEGFGAVGTLVIVHHVLHFKGLLQNCSLKSFLLNGDLDFYSSRMGLCPDEACINDADFGKASQLSQT